MVSLEWWYIKILNSKIKHFTTTLNDLSNNWKDLFLFLRFIGKRARYISMVTKEKYAPPMKYFKKLKCRFIFFKNFLQIYLHEWKNVQKKYWALMKKDKTWRMMAMLQSDMRIFFIFANNTEIACYKAHTIKLSFSASSEQGFSLLFLSYGLANSLNNFNLVRNRGPSISKVGMSQYPVYWTLNREPQIVCLKKKHWEIRYKGLIKQMFT